MVIIWKKPGDLAGVTLCLSVGYFQNVNVNKHSSSLGDHWLRFFFLHTILQSSTYGNSLGSSISFYLHVSV